MQNKNAAHQLLQLFRYSTKYRRDIILATVYSLLNKVCDILPEVLNHGRIVETGSHRQLLEDGGIYADLWALQLRDPDIQI